MPMDVQVLGTAHSDELLVRELGVGLEEKLVLALLGSVGGGVGVGVGVLRGIVGAHTDTDGMRVGVGDSELAEAEGGGLLRRVPAS